MSVVVIGGDAELTEAVVERLIAQDDTVGVITETARPRLKELGGHIALGPLDDADLIERAGQHARTLVVLDPEEPVVRAAVDAGRMLGGDDVRIVVCGRRVGRDVAAIVAASGLQYVLLRTGRRTAPQRIAEAIDAADDRAGELALDLDLNDERAWAALGL